MCGHTYPSAPLQVPGAGATVLAAMKNCLPKTGRLRMWTGRMMGDSSEDLSVSKAGPARSLLPQLSGDRLDQAAEDSLKNLGEMAIPSDGLSKTFGPPSRPSSPPAQGVARSPSSSALPVRGEWGCV